MKLAVLALAFVLLPLAGLAQEPGPEEGNRALAAAFEVAWNAHDMKAFGKLLTEDGKDCSPGSP